MEFSSPDRVANWRKKLCRVRIWFRLDGIILSGSDRFVWWRKLFCCVRIWLRFNEFFFVEFRSWFGLISNGMFRCTYGWVSTEIILLCPVRLWIDEFFLSGFVVLQAYFEWNFQHRILLRVYRKSFLEFDWHSISLKGFWAIKPNTTNQPDNQLSSIQIGLRLAIFLNFSLP